MPQTVTRIFTFDSGHRVMNEKFKCFNLHGHTYKIEATWQFNTMKSIGYAVDFKEIKRLFGQFIDDYLDHGFIANPQDKNYIDVCEEENSKIWLMSLNGMEYCNPTAENIAKEIYMIADYLVHDYKVGLRIKDIKLWETPNCFVTADQDSLATGEHQNFMEQRGELLQFFAESKGKLEYDDREKD
jgi:6-pyruvoyltetrahydropterin/6-carboxytetrahydropterin synthase